MSNFQTKNERIERRKKEIGSKNDRKLATYSENFNIIFSFFLKSYRADLLSFCGSAVNVEFDVNGFEGKNTFRRYDNGEYNKGQPIKTRHPNIVKAVICGKKAFGLWCGEWADGIAEGSFTKYEILAEFSSRNIVIPESLLLDFNNRIYGKSKNSVGWIETLKDANG